MHNMFDTEFFGEEVEPSQNANITIQIHDSPNKQNQVNTSPKKQNNKTPHLLPKKYKLIKRQGSIDCPLNQYAAQKSITPTSDSSRISKTYRESNKGKGLTDLTQRFQIRCIFCVRKVKQSCLLCKGRGLISGNGNFPKFFQYVMEFKMGLKGSYLTQKQKNQQKESPTKKQKGNFGKTQRITSISAREPTRRSFLSSTTRSGISFKEYKEKILQKRKVHENFQCDSCGINPIIGSRFHCSDQECDQDYDLCEECYYHTGHRHDMVQIQQTAMASKITNLAKFLDQKRKMDHYKDERVIVSSIQ